VKKGTKEERDERRKGRRDEGKKGEREGRKKEDGKEEVII
jgi:hypothetical protein